MGKKKSGQGDAPKGGVVKLGKSLRHSCTWVMDLAVDMKKKKKLGGRGFDNLGISNSRG